MLTLINLSMQRKTILVGDPPTSGGTVLENHCKSSINGISKALMGGKVRCDACRSIGTIVKSGGPYRPALYGSEEVLEGDLVLCRCAVAPRLIARAVSSRPPLVSVDDRIETLGPVPPPLRQFIDLTSWRKPRLKEAHSIQFAVTDQTSGQALAKTSYRITLDDGTEYIGMTDVNGLTEVIGNDRPFHAEIETPYYDGKKEITNAQQSNQDGTSDACHC